MLASASAAALTTLAVTIAVPAIADDGGNAKSPDDIAACLRDHGLAGAPDGAGLKDWLGPRLRSGDAATKRALDICAPQPVDAKPGPTEAQLRACLSANGAVVPAGDGRVLKQWLIGHGAEAPNRAALKACGMGPPPKPEVTAAQLRSCLSSRGAAVPAGDGRVLKQWILEHGDEAADRAAMKACNVAPAPKPGADGTCGKDGVVETVAPAGKE